MRGWLEEGAADERAIGEWEQIRKGLGARARAVRVNDGEGFLGEAQAWLQWWATARLLAWRLRARKTARLRAWLGSAPKAVAYEAAHDIVKEEHGAAVVRRAQAVKDSVSQYWHRPRITEMSPLNVIAAEARAPAALMRWARARLGREVVWRVADSVEQWEEALRQRAVAAGRMERLARRAGRAAFERRQRRQTWMQGWVQEGGTGQVFRPEGSWDYGLTEEEVARRERRLLRRDKFRAAKGEVSDRDGTWGFERVVNVREGRGGGVEVQVEWRGEWAGQQRSWVPCTQAYIPSLRTRRGIERMYEERFGVRRVVRRGRPKARGVEARPAHVRHQPRRGGAQEGSAFNSSPCFV